MGSRLGLRVDKGLRDQEVRGRRGKGRSNGGTLSGERRG